MAGEIEREGINTARRGRDRGIGARGGVHGNGFDANGRSIEGDAQESELIVAIAVEGDGVPCPIGFFLLARDWLLPLLILFQSRKIVVAAVARNDVGDLAAAAFHDAGVSLVEMSVAGEHHVWPDACLGAACVNCFQHSRAGHVLAAAGERRMMHGNHQRLGICVLRVGFAIGGIPLELAGKKGELGGADGGVAERADGFSGVGVEADDADERRIESKVDAGLRQGSAIEAGRALGWRSGAEIIDEGFARVAGRLAFEHEAVVVAGDGEDGTRIVAIGLVKLLGIVAFLAKEVDHVAEVIEEGRLAARPGFAQDVCSHGIGDGKLRLRAFDASGIAHAVHDELARGGDGVDGGLGEHIGERHDGRIDTRLWDRLEDLDFV